MGLVPVYLQIHNRKAGLVRVTGGYETQDSVTLFNDKVTQYQTTPEIKCTEMK